MNYAKAIRIARSIADVSQGALADRSGLDRSYLSLIEGKKRKPTLETLQTIADALHIPFHLLTLLATERKDSTKINEEQIQGLARQLTHLLLDHSDEDQIELPYKIAANRQHAKTRVLTGSKKGVPEKPA